MKAKNLLIFIMLPALSWSQDEAGDRRHPLFQNDTVLKAVLTAPISQAYDQRHQDVRIYYPGQWTYIDEAGETQRLQVSIRTRGHFRREVCQLPPLQLNFKKKEVKGTLFAGQNKVKLVAPCKEGQRYQQYVILEYLAYRIYQVLTDHSFSTRLVRLSYVDRDEELEPWTSIGFVIEDDSDMAKRLDLDRLHLDSVLYAQLDHPQLSLLQMFQFMIANNDYSVIKPSGDDDCCHNMELLGKEDTEDIVIPVPFDFDFSGLVNASYAAPPSQIPIRDVRDRYYYGLCQPQSIVDVGIAQVQSKREEILNLFRDSQELDEKTRERSISYIEKFYDILDDPEELEKKIIGRCRGERLKEKHFGEATS
jgi:hypothetical protein